MINPDEYQDNRRRDAWNSGNKDGSRNGKKEESKALVTVDGEGVDWTNHSEEDEDYALMACNGSDSDTEVTSCSTKCKESYANLKKLYDAQREQLSDASIEIKAYSQGLKKVEAQLVAHQQGQLWYEQKIKFMKIDLDDKTDVLTYHKKLLAEAQKEKDDLKAKVEKWQNSSKNLGKLLNSQMSAYDKFGLGYGDHRYNGILSYENEVLQSVFKGKESDFENPPLNDRLVTTGGMHAVPPPMTGNYMPSGPDIEIDYSQFTYGPKQTQPSESESQTSEFDTCESNISTEPSELVSEPVVNESNVECQPKVWSDAPIIEEYESDSEDEYVSIPTKEHETPSFANQQVKTPRENVKNQSTHSQKPKVNKKELGYGFTVRACFVCGSLNHLIRDCDFHEKRMARKAELNNGWNNVQRVNKQNQFVPSAVLTRTGKIPVSTARASGTKNFSTARQSFNRQTVLTCAAMDVNTVKPTVNRVRPANVFQKTHSPFSRPFKKTTVLRTDFSKQKVNTAKVNAVSTVGGKRETAVKPSAGCNWRQQRYNWNNDYPHRALKNKGIVDSGCSRHMTGNKAYLAEFQDFNGGPVAFGGSKGYITGKGTEDIIDAGDSNKEDESAQDCFVLPIWTSCSSTTTPDLKTDAKKAGPSEEEQVFLDELERLKRQEKKANEEVEALRKKFEQDTENLVIQAGAARASSTNIFSTVITPAKASSTNLVNTVSTPVSTTSPLEGLTLSDPTNPEQDDSEIPPLKDIYQNSTDGIFNNSSYDDEGAVADFTNLETVVNVSPIPTSRIHFSHPSALILGDPTSAVQTRSKVNKSSRAHAFVSYVQKQRRTNHKDFQHCLFACFLSHNKPKKILEALKDENLPYGKKVVSTKWVYRNKKDERGVVVRNKARLVAQGHRQEEGIDYDENRYRRRTIDKTLFLKKDKYDIILIQVYVDDIIFGSTKKSWCDKFEALMKSRFQMSSMGELTFFLGLQVKQKEDGIFISQDKYVAEILKKFDFANVKTASTPIETQKPLVKDEEASDVDVHLYRSMIGSLMYLTASRPDIMFAVCACSRFQVTPKSSHLSVVKRIFRYLKGKPKLGLWYPRVSSFDLESYSDSDYAGANLDRKSTTRGCQFLGRRLISWQCKKQTIVATSTIEAEYVTAASCCGQVLKIHTDDNVADLLTKAFDVSRFQFLVVTIGMLAGLMWMISSLGLQRNHGCDEFEALMKSRFQMSSMGELTFFLGLQSNEGRWYLYSQLGEEASDGEVHLYRSMIGSLMSCLLSRHDIMFAVCACSRVSSFDLESYSYSDYAGANLDRKSTTGGCQFLGRRLISWQCKKQTIVATSTTEAEYVAAASCFDLLTKAFDVSRNMLTIGDAFQSTMAVLDSCPKHNMVAYVEKSEGNAEFHEIIDFLKRSSIHHALTVSPIVSTTFVEQFWMSAKSKTINNVRHITAKVAGKSVSISEASIRSDLLFDDADRIDSLPNQAIFDAIQLMGYEGDLTVLTFNKALFSPQWRFLFHTINHCLSSKSTSWDQIPTNIATAVICLTTNQKYNFSKLIFDGMLRHLDAKKKFVMYPRFISIFLGNQLANVSIPLDHFLVNTLTSKVFSFMVKKGKHFSGKVTPLFATMLVQPTQDEGANSERPSEALSSPSPAPTSEVPNEPQNDSSPAQTSEVPFEQQTDLSPSPSPIPIIPDSIPDISGENLGGHSSSDKSLSGNEGDMTLQSIYDLCISLCTQVIDQAKEIQQLKAQITKLKKQAKPVIKHHRAWLKSVSLKQRFPSKSFSKKHRVHKEYVSKQGRKFAKGESSVQRDPLFDEVPEDTADHMETENA
ncbi:putative ribonuclease H-like domain-containing protein [Tanacetum coccineum]